MRKITTIMLALSMVLSLVACSSQKGTVVETTQAAVETTTEAETTIAAETTKAPETTQAETEAEVTDLSDSTLLIYCGAGMQKPFQEIADAFQEETGCQMNVTFANAAQIQTQIKESGEGDFFISGSKEELKPVADYVASSVDLVKHIPVLVVAAGNEKGITGIADLANDDIVTVIGDPESTPIGKIAVKAFEDFGITDQVNLGATTTTAPQLATVVGMGEADAAIIWKENAKADGVEICESEDMDAYVKVIPAALLTSSEAGEAAEVFSEFLNTEEVHDIWASYGYELAE